MTEKKNISSEKSFGIVFSVFFLILTIYCLIKDISAYYIFISISILFLIIAFTKPKILKIPNFLWYKLSIALSKISSPIIMLLIYSISILPIGIILKIIGKKSDIKKIDHKSKSYWIKRSGKENSSMIDQF